MTVEMPGIVPIVEGPGDKDAAPILLRRLLHERMCRYDIGVLQPKMAKGRPRLIQYMESFLGYARITPGCDAILVLLDADKKCPREFGVELAHRAGGAGVGIPIAVVCANPEYENWFLASDDAFAGDVEEYGGAKEWLSRNKMPQGLAYKETQDQVKFSAAID